MKVYIIGQTIENLTSKTFNTQGLKIKDFDGVDVTTEDVLVQFSTGSIQRAVNFNNYGYDAVVVEVDENETTVITQEEPDDDYVDYFMSDEEALNYLNTAKTV